MNPEAVAWLATAPRGLVALLRRMKHHVRIEWQAEDYIPDEAMGPNGDGRIETELLENAEANGSQIRASADMFEEFLGTGSAVVGEPVHVLAIDLDIPAYLIPSSTEGHSHLYVDLQVGDAALWRFLDAAVAIGLVEKGYVAACKSRGMTSLRAPWVRKGAEPPHPDQTADLPASQPLGGTHPQA